MSRDGLGDLISVDFSQPTALGTCLRCASDEAECGSGCIKLGTCCKSNPSQGSQCAAAEVCSADGGQCLAIG